MCVFLFPANTADCEFCFVSDPSILTLTDVYCTDYVVEPADVEYRLAHINIFKAPGLDSLPSWLLRDFAPFLCQPLAAIFNATIREGYVPPIWKAADVIPVPKIPRPQSIQTDIRPISLLPCLAKVLESVVGQWIRTILEPQFDPHQFGCSRNTLWGIKKHTKNVFTITSVKLSLESRLTLHTTEMSS